MKNIVITIARQYGSGGRTVGKMLAEELGIHYYDKELSKVASDISGINESYFVDADEKVRNNWKNKIALGPKVYDGKVKKPGDYNVASDEDIFSYQANALKMLAVTKEPCVIIGRCADFVLKDYDNVMSVFVHADQDFLMQEAGKVQPLTGKDLEKYIAQIDKARADYYEYHTGHVWTDALNYDLCLDSGKLGFEKCVEAIKAYARVRFGEDCFD
ncbi:AAA family ATPase [Butyrivibrio sp. INlla16]|uniref:cytidylate kinase-like family protein n=1 Tax=Butyrivibrio sp. INlla16 TaxID=1520807 RepID=UPI00088F9911|nr:cytidylate kinase-like family protein [Butyrivibrio sp. INlla16]SDB41022.1 Cytidylate kinase-like family protein [Butyrivibrio sp. INlla16]